MALLQVLAKSRPAANPSPGRDTWWRQRGRRSAQHLVAEIRAQARSSCGGWKCSIWLSNQTELRNQTRSQKIATARHCRRGPRAYPAI